MITRTTFVNMGWFLIAFFLLLPAKQGLCAEGPSANNISSASNASDELEKRIYQLVKDLEYSDQVAKDFVKMVRPWKCNVLYQKLSQAAQDVKQKKISWNQYAQVEEESIKLLTQIIRKEIRDADVTNENHRKYFDLALVIKDKKAQCLGYTQVFYILGNSMGLAVEGIQVEEDSKGPRPVEDGHTACAVGLHNGKAIQVDLTLKDCVSRTFLFTEEYSKAGNYWELKDKSKHLDIYPRIQLLYRNGIAARIYSNRGAIYTKTGKLEEAISDCTKAIELNSKDAEAYYNRANVYIGTGQFDKAIADYSKAIELNPIFIEAYNNRGVIYRESGQLDKAISDYTRAIEIRPKDSKAYYNRGTVYDKLGQIDKAISDCTKAIGLNPKYAEAYGVRGSAYARLGKMEDAKNDLRKVMQLNPGLKEKVEKAADQYKLDL